MRCAACHEVNRGFEYRHYTEQIKIRCAACHEVNRGLDTGNTLIR